MHALVTGASSGIGEALARLLAAGGYDLTLVARRKAELERVAAAVPRPARASIFVRDMADLESLTSLVPSAEDALGPVDLLVNNAGVDIVRPTMEVSLEEGERLLRVNVLAPFRLTRAVLPGMLERGRGTIVDISSVAARAHPPFQSHYSASKAALAAMSVSLGHELRRKGVHFLTVYPGPVRTPMGEASSEAYGKNSTQGLMIWGDADGLARRIVRAVERRRSTVVYPRFYWIPILFPGISLFFMDRFGPRSD